MDYRSPFSRNFYRFSRRTLQLIGVLGWGLRRSGLENIPAEGGALVLSNHQSHLDPPLLGLSCPRPMGFLARQTLFSTPLMEFLMSVHGAFPIDREGSGLAGIKETLRRLKRGEMVVIFPEGTRTSDGEIAPFKPGFTALARRGKVPILPVAIEGAHGVWPRGGAFPGPGTIQLHFGPTMPFDQIARLDDSQLIAECERRVHECQAVLRRRPVFAKGDL